MMILSLCIALAAVVLTIAVIRRLQYVTHLSKIPGPKAYPLVGALLPFLFLDHLDRPKTLIDASLKFDGLMVIWVGPIAVVQISRADLAEEFLTSTSPFKKEYYYSYLEPWLGLGLLISTGERWYKHRKMLTPAFHFKILESFVDTFIEQANTLVSLLEKHVDGETFDMDSYISKCTLDIICETAMGTSVNAQLGDHLEYVTAVTDASNIFSKRLFNPWLHFDWIFRSTRLGRQFYKDLRVLHSFTEKVIHEKKEQKKIGKTKKDYYPISEENIYYRKKKLAFLDLMLEASEDGKCLSDDDIRQEVDTFMFEGHDTTSSAIIWTLFLLGEHPHCQDKVYNELQEVLGSSARAITIQDLSQLSYLEMVIKESLRLFPSVSNIGRILAEDITLGGHRIPAGTGINLFIHIMHRREEFFPNPEEFNPENFLPENVLKRHPFAYIPFSAGSRNCIGQKFAMLEMKVVLSSILRNYVIETQECLKKVRILLDVISRPENGLQVKIKRR